jgi:murein DD-endopeptidase MepM/ murein hydrolase activator NlpD
LRLASTAVAAVCALALAAPAFASYPDNTGGARLRSDASREFAVPLKGPFESPFGYRWGRLHAGVDIAVLKTDRVRAALDGVVVRTGYQNHYAGYGNVIVLRHGNGLVTLYAHLAAIGVNPGEQVWRGELIGRAGCTGSCTGQHLHFEVHVNGVPVNPERFLRQLR